MLEPEKKQSWWQTLPGVLTAAAALITAVTGLVAVLVPHGVNAGRGASGDPDTAAHAGTGTRERVPGGSAPDGDGERDADPATGGRPWSEAEARIRGRDGSVTAVRAETLSSCISVSHELTLVAGQSVPFERMRWFRVVESDPTGAPNAKARVEIGVLGGDTLRGQVDADCDVFGYNDAGRFALTLQRLDRVDFRR